MNGILKILGVALAAQLLVVVLLNLRPDRLQSFSSDSPLVEFDQAKADRLVVSDKDKSLVLVKKANTWTVEDQNSFPADTNKVESLVNAIADFKRGWPVAQTTAAFKSLKVTEQDLERRIIIQSGSDNLADLILGTSPGFKKVHARISNDNFVYVLNLNTADISLNAADWHNREFLYVAKEDVEYIELPQLKLLQTGQQILPEDLAANEESNKTELDALLGQVLQIRYIELLGKDQPKEFAKLKEKTKLAIKLKNIEPVVNYDLRGPYQDNFYILKRSSEDYYFKVPKGLAEKLRDIKRENLVQVKDVEPEKQAEEVQQN